MYQHQRQWATIVQNYKVQNKIVQTVQTFTQRFTQVLSELRYATQAEHTSPVERQVVLKIIENEALLTYISNLKKDIGHLIIHDRRRFKRPVILRLTWSCDFAIILGVRDEHLDQFHTVLHLSLLQISHLNTKLQTYPDFPSATFVEN